MRAIMPGAVLRALPLLLSLFVIPVAEAQLFRTYLSLTGNDGNPCTLQAPCRLLPKALTAVRNGGEIWMLDSANFNTTTVTIDKSVTILAIPGALGSVVAVSGPGSNGNAIDIAAGAGEGVTLRNLNILNLSGTGHGINYVAGGPLTVEECEIYGLAGDGIHVTSPTNLVVKNTTIRDSVGAGIFISGTAGASLQHVSLFELDTGIKVSAGTMLTLRDSLIGGGITTGVSVTAGNPSFTRVIVDNTVVRDANVAIDVVAVNAGDGARVTVSRSTLTHNNTGIKTQAGAGSAVVTLDGNVIQHQGTGVSMNGGVVNTRGNNTMNFVTTAVAGGVLTSVGGI